MPTVSIHQHAVSVAPKARTLRPVQPQCAAELGLLLDHDGHLADPTPAQMALRQRYEDQASVRWPGRAWRWEALPGEQRREALAHLPVRLPLGLIVQIEDEARRAGLTTSELVRRLLVEGLSPRA